MPWRDIAITAREQLIVLLVAYTAPLLIARVGYVLQIDITDDRKTFVALLRRRWARQWLWVGVNGAFFAGSTWILALVASALLSGVNVIVSFFVAGIALFVFVDGLLFAALPGARRWRPAISKDELPTVFGQVHGSRRARIGLQIYWYSLVRRVTFPAFMIAFVMGLAKRPVQPVGWLIVWTPALFAYYWLRSVPSRVMPAAAALLVLGEVEHAMRGPTPHVRAQAADGDPLDWYRYRLWLASTHLEREARWLDRTMHRPDQHPVGSVLRAAAQHLRSFIVSATSLAGRLPVDIQVVVSGVVLVVAGPGRAEPYRQLAQAVDAFDTDGQPTIARRRFRPAIGTALIRAGEGSKALHNIVTLFGALLVVVLGIWLVATGKLDLTKIDQWLSRFGG
jgi:hypothetical protein